MKKSGYTARLDALYKQLPGSRGRTHDKVVDAIAVYHHLLQCDKAHSIAYGNRTGKEFCTALNHTAQINKTTNQGGRVSWNYGNRNKGNQSPESSSDSPTGTLKKAGRIGY